MTLVRRCRVVACGPDGLRLAAEPGACSGCSGCGGRCALWPTGHDALALPADRADAALAVGETVELYLGERSLLAEAARGYGLPLLGLLAGAIFGRGLAAIAALDPDATTLFAAAAGTLAGLALSKRHSAPACRVRPAAPAG